MVTERSRIAAAAWAWVALLIAASAKPFWWNLRYVQSGTPYFSLYLGGLLLLLVLVAAYLWAREAFPVLRRFELAGLSALLLGFYLVEAPAATLLALWVAFVSFSAGRALFLLLGAEVDSSIERLTLWTAAGLGLASAAMFLLGLLQLYRRWLLFLILVLLTCVCRRGFAILAADLRRVYAAATETGVLAGPLMGGCILFGALATALSAVVVLTPETSWDPIFTHLYEARFYAETHAFHPPPEFTYHYFPKAVEMIQTLGFVLHSQPAAEVLGYLFTPLALAAVFLLARRWFSTGGAVLAMSLAAVTPLIVLDGAVAKNDLGMALYQLLSLYAFLRWREEQSWGWAKVMAVFVGFSFAVKHTAVLGFVPLSLLIGAALWKQPVPLRRRLLAALVLIGIACLAGGFWHLRTWAMTGSVIYPTKLRGGAGPSYTKDLTDYPRALYGMFYRPRYRYAESPSPNPLGFALPALLPFLFLAPRRRGAADGALLFFTCGAFLLWVPLAENLRFLIPALLALSVVLAGRACSFYSEAGRAAKAACLAGLGYCLVFAFQVSVLLTVNVPRLKYLAGKLDREAYLTQALSVYPALSFLNRTAGSGEQIYAVISCARLYSKLPIGCWLTNADRFSYQFIANEVASGRYTYLLVPAAIAPRLPPEIHSRQIYQDADSSIFRLGSGLGPTPSHPVAH